MAFLSDETVLSYGGWLPLQSAYAMIGGEVNRSMSHPDEQLLNTRQAAAEAHVAQDTILAWIHGGIVPGVRQGSRYYVRRGDLARKAGPNAVSLMHHLTQQYEELERRYTEEKRARETLERRVAVLEALLIQRGQVTLAEWEALIRAGQPPTPPRPLSRREVAHWLAGTGTYHAYGGHGVKFGTAMNWFERDPPMPQSKEGALRYAVGHYADVKYRGRGGGERLHQCHDPACECHALADELSLPLAEAGEIP